MISAMVFNLSFTGISRLRRSVPGYDTSPD
jgi:hypothetical protein